MRIAVKKRTFCQLLCNEKPETLVCASVNMCRCVHKGVPVWARTLCLTSFHPISGLFRQVLSLNLMLTNLARIGGQQGPGALLSLSPNTGITEHYAMPHALYVLGI